MLRQKIQYSILWRMRHVNQQRLVIMLAVFVGFIGGFAAVILKTLVHYMELLVTHSFAADKENYLYLAAPLVGILITVWYLRTFIKDKIGHGISRILYAISKRKGNIKSHNMYSSIIGCSITSGFGGSVGMEAPIVYTGSAIGSNLASYFRLNYKTKILLIGCGAAAAVSGIFKAPIAGVIFCLEILMLDLTTASIIPLLISSVAASVVSHFFLGGDITFNVPVQDPFKFKNILFYILLGVFAGLVSLYFTRTNAWVEKRFKKVQNAYSKVLIGGTLLGVLIFFFPPLYGEGYRGIDVILNQNINSLFDNSIFYHHSNGFYLIVYLVLILFFKVFATATTTGAGGIGGVFAPSLFMGAFTGLIFAKSINLNNWGFKISENNFALAGMAGLMSGMMHAPLTAIFLIAEITGSYQLILPLMVTASISYLTMKYFEPHSIYTKRLAEEGALITHHKDKAVLTVMNIKEVVETNFTCLHPSDNLKQITMAVRSSKRNIFPIVDGYGNFKGLISLDEIRDIMFDTELYETVFAEELSVMPACYVELSDSMDSVLDKFTKSELWNIPVLEGEKYLGFVSRSNIFAKYREHLIEISED